MTDYISSEMLREMAYEVAEAGRERGVKRALVGLTVEQVLQIAEQLQELEDAHAAADSAIFDDQTAWPDSDEGVQ